MPVKCGCAPMFVSATVIYTTNSFYFFSLMINGIDIKNAHFTGTLCKWLKTLSGIFGKHFQLRSPQDRVCRPFIPNRKRHLFRLPAIARPAICWARLLWAELNSQSVDTRRRLRADNKWKLWMDVRADAVASYCENDHLFVRNVKQILLIN